MRPACTPEGGGPSEINVTSPGSGSAKCEFWGIYELGGRPSRDIISVAVGGTAAPSRSERGPNGWPVFKNLNDVPPSGNLDP